MNNMKNSKMSVLAELGIDPNNLRSIKPPSRRNHYRAIANWLERDLPESFKLNLSNYLQVIYHLSEVKAWEKVDILLSLYLSDANGNTLGTYFKNRGLFQEVISIYEDLLKKGDDIKSLSKYRWLSELMSSHMFLGSVKQAVFYFSDMNSLVELIQDDLSELDVQQDNSIPLLSINEKESSAVKVQQLLFSLLFSSMLPVIAQTSKLDLLEISTFLENIFNLVNNEAYENEDMCKQTQSLRAHIFICIGIFKLQFGSLGEAYKCFEVCLVISEEYRNYFLHCWALNFMGIVALLRRRYSDAIKCQEDRFQLSELHRDFSHMASSLSWIIQIYISKKKYSLALKYCQKYLSLSVENQDCWNEANALRLTAYTHDQMRNYKVSISFYRDYIEKSNAINDGTSEGWGHQYLSTALSSLERYEESLNHAKASLSLAKESVNTEMEFSSRNAIYFALLSIGKRHLKLKEYQEAKSFFLKP